ncbi:glutamine-hydrolyzing GMP synthase [Candidatus Daviesbacteria bacterium]|nr:glutamine-hydrolyzing GMP synthase [Candidatus Daviesbacteria bacterium]
MIIIIDFGSQTAHLISRRIRELGQTVMVVEPEDAIERIKEQNPQGIIFSGGPASVYGKNSPTVDKQIFEMRIPILGICYGQQLIAHILDGKVSPGKIKEYGPAVVTIEKDSPLFENTAKEFNVWMSHGDEVKKAPGGFKIVAHTKTIPVAAISNEKKKIYAIQFHPEVIHTQFGQTLLGNFLKICGIEPKRQEIDSVFIEGLIDNIRQSLGNEKAICALSGGVDSSVAALLVHKAIGENLTCFYIDSGLMREGETDLLKEVFKENYDMRIEVIDAEDEFLDVLRGVIDPEKKRKKIGETFIRVFEKEAKKLGAKFLVQGTIYPDVIESQGSKHSEKIKSHHNVGGLPEDMEFTLVEPLRTFYKDEVRLIGQILGMPESITKRQPFPGPGLAVRIVGEVNKDNLKILRKADAIVREEIENFGFTNNLWQAFAVFTGIKTTGVRGDQRVYGETIAIRAIEAKDAMSADFAKLPWGLLQRISNRIVTEVPDVNRVVYDISTKPPATMEWE